jgi:FMN phosphatase YigB (HAD superfamily)
MVEMQLATACTMPKQSKTATKSRRTRTPAARPRIQCVIFDLDDTLYDCLGQRVKVAHRHAADAMVKAGLKGEVEAVYRARLRAFRKDPMLRYIDPEVTRRFGAEDPDAVMAAARDAYFHCPVGKLTLFRGSLPALRWLAAQGVRNFIVSFGEPKIQHQKVKALGLDREHSVTDIFYADRSNLLTKEAAFRKIQREMKLQPAEILVVGDRPAREIRAGKELGMHTVRVHRGEFKSQMPGGPEEEPDFVVEDISELRNLPFRWGPAKTETITKK